MDANYFRQCMELMVGIIDPREPRTALRGVLLEFKPGHVNMVSTNGNRIAVVRAEAAHMMGEASIIIRPPQGLEALGGVVTFIDGMVMDEGGRFVTLETIAAPVIDWRRAVTVKTEPSHVAVNTELLADTLQRLVPFGWVSVSNGRVEGGPCICLTAHREAKAVVMGIKPGAA